MKLVLSVDKRKRNHILDPEDPPLNKVLKITPSGIQNWGTAST